MIKIDDYYGLGSDKAILDAALSYLGVDDIEIVVTRNDNLIQRYSNDRWVVGAICYRAPKPLTSHYTLCVSSNPEKAMPLLLCHEAIHLAQFQRGDLELNLETKEFTWKGRKYSNNVEYKARPWEIEAFTNEAKILAKVKKGLGIGQCKLFSFLGKGKKK